MAALLSRRIRCVQAFIDGGGFRLGRCLRRGCCDMLLSASFPLWWPSGVLERCWRGRRLGCLLLWRRWYELCPREHRWALDLLRRRRWVRVPLFCCEGESTCFCDASSSWVAAAARDRGILFRLAPSWSPGRIFFLFLQSCEDGCVLSTESRRRGWPMVLAFAALTKVLESFSVVEGGSHRTSAYGSCRSWS